MKDLALTLACQFADVIEAWTSPAELAEIKRKNATAYAHADACATQDIMDANDAMMEAFLLVCGYHPAFIDDETDDADMALWNEAWDIAKLNFLS